MSAVPIDPRGFRLSVGLRSLDISQWFDSSDSTGEYIEHKKTQLLKDFSNTALMTPDSLPAQREITQSIFDHLGVTFHGDEAFPLLSASLMVAEDLCVLERHETDWILTAAVVASPSRWKLSEKIGTSMTRIHAPVPGYESELDHAVRVTFDKLTVERPVYRFNWTLMDSAEKFQDSATVNTSVTAENAGEMVFLRVERQTLRRYPESDAILFTIGTQIQSLNTIFASDKEASVLLHRGIRTMSQEHCDYRSWDFIKPAVLTWLENHHPDLA